MSRYDSEAIPGAPRRRPARGAALAAHRSWSIATKAIIAGALVALIAGGVFLWRQQAATPAQAPVATPPPPAEPAPAPVGSAEPTALEPEPAIKYPVEAATAPPLAPTGLASALTQLLGRKAIADFLQIDEFPRRFVATVDNLGRQHAPPMLWPVRPAPGRFTVAQADGAAVIGADNGARYTPLVLLAETVDARRAVDLYARMYPLLQQAYEELGFPKAYFNDRLVAVIDLLLATPDASYPIKLQLTEVKGPVSSERPWTRYEFADPALESLSAGQKILVRVGPVNQRRLKARLAEIRRELTRSPPPR